MKSFYKLLSLVLTLTMMVSLVAMPSALAAVYYVGDTSAYKIEAKFVDASGADISSVATGETVYVALALKSFSTLQMGYADITLEGASFKTETNKLVSDIFMRDTDTSVFKPGEKTATYGIVYQSTSLMTSANGKAKYYAFPTATDIPLALYEVTVDGGATEVSVSITGQNFKVGDAKGATNKLATAETTVIATEGDNLALGSGGGNIPDAPVVTYKYAAEWKGANVFPAGTTDEEIKDSVWVYMETYLDGAFDKRELLATGYKVELDNGNVDVTIDGEPDADITCDLTYTITAPDPVITCDYDVEWMGENSFVFGTTDAYIKSMVKVIKYTFTDGIKTNTETLTTGFTVELDNGIAVVRVDGKIVNLPYTIIDKVVYKNAKLNANKEYEYTFTTGDIEEAVSVTVEKWVNDALDSTITLVPGDDYELTIIFDENYNNGKIDVALIGDYINVVAPQSVIFERINPTITYSDASAALTQREFHESATEADIEAAVSAKAMKKVGNLQAKVVTLVKGTDYTVSVDLEAKQVTVTYSTEIGCNNEVLDFDIILAVITYANPDAVLSDSVFGATPEAADIIARLTVTADMLKDGAAAGTVTITSDNYDVTVDEGFATIIFKNAYADLEPATVDFTVEEVAYGDPVITVDGAISGDGKDDAAIIEEAWSLIAAARDILTNGVVTGSETLDKAALEALNVTVSYAGGKVTFAFNGAVIAEVSVSTGTLQIGSVDPRTAATEFIKFVGATLKDIFDNIKIKKDTFQIITLNADEWVTLTEAIEEGSATVTVGGDTYDSTNIAAADSVVVDNESSVNVVVEYSDVVADVDITLLSNPTDYANEATEAPVVTITTDATQVQTGTDVTATVYVSGLTGNIETGNVSLLFSNADVALADIVAADGFEILSKEISGNEIYVVFTINDAAYNAGAGIFKVTFDTTNSDVNAKLGLAIKDYALTRIVDMGTYKEYKPVNAEIGDNVEVTVTAGDVLGFDYEVSYASGKTAFYTDAEAVADVKVLAYTTTNGVRDPEQTPQDVTAAASINANNGVITVDKDGVRVTTLTYTIYEVAFDQTVAIETIGSVDDAKFTENVTVKLNGTVVNDATVVLDGRNIKVSVAGIKAEGTYEIAVAVPGYTKATVNVVVAKKATLDGYDATVVTGSKIYAGDINGDNRIDAVDFSDVAGKYGQVKETKYDLYTGNTSATIDNLDVTTMAHYFITLARGQVSADGTTVTPYSAN